ncbi:MAG: PilZ domain-containing protein [Acidobacteria bacterium]|nr:PilZ domain-containing protein [Acidobacteriota bacterium]MDA1235346.1 PilZ domain-containing protein [Acidobacteriota bacterium]
MSLLSFKRGPASRRAPDPAVRPVLIEWRDEAGEKVWQQTHLVADRFRGLTVVVPQRPPTDAVAQVREAGSSYPVEVLTTNPVDGGFELSLDYLWDGRRRDHRTPASGPATLKPEGLPPIPVEVINVSAGGMQLFAASSAPEGSLARIGGTDTELLCLVRCCVVAPGGYFMGLQFYAENRREKNYGDA